MGKVREGFENTFPEKSIFEYVDYDSEFNMYGSKEHVSGQELIGLFAAIANLNGAWWAWQSRQAEVDRLNSVLDERTKEWLEAIELGEYFENVAKPLKAELDEKDKRIQKATAKWISITSILTTTDAGVPDVIFKQLDELHDALIGIEEFEESLRGNDA